MNRLVLLGETLRHALNVLAPSAPEWLKPQMEPAWVEHYERRLDEYRLPKAATEREALASQWGADGRQLLRALFAAESPKWLRELDCAACPVRRQCTGSNLHYTPDAQGELIGSARRRKRLRRRRKKCI